MKDYLACVQSVDDNVGRVLKYLDDSGLAQNTIVIYTSDQGFFLGEHGWYDKRFMYEESLRTPLLVRWPGVARAGSSDEHIVLNLDFAQTILDAAGTPQPKDMQGRSLVPLLKGESPADWRTSMYYHYYEYPQSHKVREHYGMRTDRYKLIHFYTTSEWELFDLKADPQEMKSVYADPAYAEARKELEAELKRLQEQFKVDKPEGTDKDLRNRD
jgi:arylsulfatase A-like enzyme